MAINKGYQNAPCPYNKGNLNVILEVQENDYDKCETENEFSSPRT